MENYGIKIREIKSANLIVFRTAQVVAFLYVIILLILKPPVMTSPVAMIVAYGVLFIILIPAYLNSPKTSQYIAFYEFGIE